MSGWLSVSSNAVAVATALDTLADDMPDVIDIALEEGLDALIAAAQPITPERSGAMKQGYSRQVTNGHGELVNDRFYSEWVAWSGTKKMQPNPGLHALLDHADDVLEPAVNDTLTQWIEALL